jgi:hypothetical protein
VAARKKRIELVTPEFGPPESTDWTQQRRYINSERGPGL